jgi:hypothetical protein
MNILDHVAIRVPCNVCSGELNVPASVVLEGLETMTPDCPGSSDYECESRFVATLADAQALKALQAAWAGFEASVRSHGGAGVMLVGLPIAPGPTLPGASERIWRAKAIQRWENEGGHLFERRRSPG